MAPTYERSLAPGRSYQERLRRRAVARLELAPGATVVDAGCGTGASLPLLVEAVGPAGRVVGVDQSSGMLAEAARRIDEQGWSNFELIEAPVQDAAIPPGADAALFFFTHDLLRTPAALRNVIGDLAPGSMVVAAGAKRPAGWLTPAAIPAWLVMRRYVTTSEGTSAPWSLLAGELASCDVEEHVLGFLYLAAGRARG
jgi:precorrin-6B methylase 2